MFAVYLNTPSGKIITPSPVLSRLMIRWAPSQISPAAGAASNPSTRQSSSARG